MGAERTVDCDADEMCRESTGMCFSACVISYADLILFSQYVLLRIVVCRLALTLLQK